MPNLISKSIIHLLTNVKYGILEQFSWDRSFKNLDVNEMVFLFNETIKKNILLNYIPHEIIMMIEIQLGLTIIEKNDTFQCYLHSNKDPKLFNKVEYHQKELKSLIEA